MESKIQNVFNVQRELNKTNAPSGFLQRVKTLKKLKKWILNNRAAITTALFKDLGRNETETELTETFVVLQEIKHTLKNLERWMQQDHVSAPLTFLGTRSFIHYEPKGVCLIISPWNYPFQLAAGALVSALAAGNSVIIKPSELTPYTSALICKMCSELFNENEVAVFEGNKEVSHQLLQLAFDHILFIGSPAVGKIVMEAAAKNLTSITLELGGKSPVIIASDADLNDAANKISSGKFLNCGQSCVAPDYVLIHESVIHDFIQQLIAETKRKFSDKSIDFEKSPNYARIVNGNNLHRIKNYIADAVLKGAKIELGGKINEHEKFIEPTVLSGVSLDSLIMEEEIFGPVLPIITFKNVTDVLSLIKSKQKPLNAYVFSKNKKLIRSIIENTSSGTVCVNDCNIQFMQTALPFGGTGNSGMGKTHGYAGFLSFSNVKSILKQRIGLTMAKLLYPPFTAGKKRIADILIKCF